MRRLYSRIIEFLCILTGIVAQNAKILYLIHMLECIYVKWELWRLVPACWVARKRYCTIWTLCSKWISNLMKRGGPRPVCHLFPPPLLLLLSKSLFTIVAIPSSYFYSVLVLFIFLAARQTLAHFKTVSGLITTSSRSGPILLWPKLWALISCTTNMPGTLRLSTPMSVTHCQSGVLSFFFYLSTRIFSLLILSN